ARCPPSAPPGPRIACPRARCATARCWATRRGKARTRWPRNSAEPRFRGSQRGAAPCRSRPSVRAAAPPRAARRRAAPSDLAGRDRVLEPVRLELIEPLSAGLAVGIHEKRKPRAFRLGQVDVVPGDVRETGRLPAADEPLG